MFLVNRATVRAALSLHAQHCAIARRLELLQGRRRTDRRLVRILGLTHIDVEDWRVHTVYEGTYTTLGERAPVVVWFWGIVSGFSEEEKARLLQFATGTSRPPAQGFKALQSNDGYVRRFAINGTALPPANEREAHPEALWPRAHTCFNKIDLPEFETREELERMLTLSINMEIGGFTME